MTHLAVRPRIREQAEATRRPAIRVASFDDYEQISTLERSYGLTPKEREEWLDLWQRNPAYRTLNDWPIGWVLEDDRRRVVGSIGNIPFHYHFGGRTYLGAVARGWAVDGAYRSFSLLLLARQLQQGCVDLHVATTANPITAGLLTKLGWQHAPAGEWNRAGFWITSYTEAVNGYLARRTPKLISALATRLLYLPLVSIDFAAAIQRGSRSGCNLRWCGSFDERFDQFWNDLCEQSRDVLLAARAADYLRWHFGYGTDKSAVWVLTASEGSRLVAYAILGRRDIQSLGLRRVMLMDFQTLRWDEDIAAAIIACGLERCRSEGIHILENLGCWLEEQQPGIRPPYHRGLETWCAFYKLRNKQLEDALGVYGSWFPTQYDGDASL